MRQLGTLFALTCVSTVISQGLGFSYLWWSGRLDHESLEQIVSVLHGVDLVPAIKDSRHEKDGEARPLSFEEITEQRVLRCLNLTLREQVIQQGLRQLDSLQRSAQQETSTFDRRRKAFKQELELVRTTARNNALVEVRRTIENMEPALAKEQLVRMMDQGESDVVVAMLKAMPLEFRNDILAEFRGTDDGMLSEILRQMLQGVPESTIAGRALGQLDR